MITRRREAEADVADAVSALVAELRAGVPPLEALRRAGDAVSPHPWPQASAAAALGAPVAEALRADARRYPHDRALAMLAATWALTSDVGSSLVPSLTRLAASMRDDERIRRELQATLAGTRATARLLAGLPAIGLGLGALLGAHPWTVLLGSPAGWAILVAGVALQWLGWQWTRALVRGVERQL